MNIWHWLSLLKSQIFKEQYFNEKTTYSTTFIMKYTCFLTLYNIFEVQTTFLFLMSFLVFNHEFISIYIYMQNRITLLYIIVLIEVYLHNFISFKNIDFWQRNQKKLRKNWEAHFSNIFHEYLVTDFSIPKKNHTDFWFSLWKM